MQGPLMILLAAIVFAGCENAGFDKDRRQIMAKDAIRSKLPHTSRNFDVVRYNEDTLASWSDTTFKRPIRYVLDYVYTDSTGALQQRSGMALFTPDGRSLIKASADNPVNP